MDASQGAVSQGIYPRAGLRPAFIIRHLTHESFYGRAGAAPSIPRPRLRALEMYIYKRCYRGFLASGLVRAAFAESAEASTATLAVKLRDPYKPSGSRNSRTTSKAFELHGFEGSIFVRRRNESSVRILLGARSSSHYAKQDRHTWPNWRIPTPFTPGPKPVLPGHTL